MVNIQNDIYIYEVISMLVSYCLCAEGGAYVKLDEAAASVSIHFMSTQLIYYEIKI